VGRGRINVSPISPARIIVFYGLIWRDLFFHFAFFDVPLPTPKFLALSFESYSRTCMGFSLFFRGYVTIQFPPQISSRQYSPYRFFFLRLCGLHCCRGTLVLYRGFGLAGTSAFSITPLLLCFENPILMPSSPFPLLSAS